MWLLCFFDLPVGDKAQRRRATRFRKHLLDDGFIMLQWSVYARLCRGVEGAEKHQDRMGKVLPDEGSVRCLQVTDKQFGRMRLLLGVRNDSERQASEQLVLL